MCLFKYIKIYLIINIVIINQDTPLRIRCILSLFYEESLFNFSEMSMFKDLLYFITHMSPSRTPTKP